VSSLSRRIGRALKMDFDYVAQGGAWLTVDHVINVATSIATTVVLTNVVGKDTYGSYTYLMGIFMLLLPITVSGISNAMIRSIARGHEGVLWKGTRTRLLGGFAVTIVLAGVSTFFYYQQRMELAWVTAAVCILYPFAFAADDYKSYYQARRDFYAYAVVDSAVNILVCAATIVAALTSGSLLAILGANLASRGVGNLAAFYFAYTRRENDSTDPEFGRLGRNFSIVAAINNVSFTIDQVLVGSLFSMEIMASYGLATRLSEPFRVIGFLINRLAWPKAVKMGGAEAARKFYSKFFILLAVLVLMAAGVLGLFPLLIRWVFPRYTDATSLTFLMVISSLLSVLVTYLETYYISQDHLQRFYYAASTLRPALTILLMYPFIKIWGFYGAVYARLLVRFAAAVILCVRMQPERFRKNDEGNKPA
jgi:O-antigen/teichoic acid export membrane protein